MKKMSLLLFIVLCGRIAQAQLGVSGMLTENQRSPMGMDVARPRFTWMLNSDLPSTLQSAYEINVTSGKQKVWSTGKVQSDQSLLVEYAGPSLASDTRYGWQVRVWDNHGRVSAWSEPARFHTGFFSADQWKAKWITIGFKEDSIRRPVQYYRTTFSVRKKILHATAFVTSQGMYEGYLNGQRIGNDYLTPGWTSYKKRLQYQAYDVTSQLMQGENAIGALVGNGWFRGTLGWTNNVNIYGSELALLFQLHITYADGSKDIVASNEKWKSAYGAIGSSEIYHGEEIDARMEQKGWNGVGFNDAQWNPVRILDAGVAHLIGTYNEPIRKHETFKAPRVITTPKGEKVLDFGQNLVGWVKVTASGKAGDRIIIKHAEVLDKWGNFYTDNMRAARTTASYVLSGNAVDVFEPHFTFYGFRYIKIEGDLKQIDPSQFEAIVLYSDMQRTGDFSTSHPLINQLQHNIQWGQRGNFLDVPTDCPQRDERLGWTGDAQAFSRTASFNFNTHAFMAKWLRDVEADQLPNGSVPFVIPNVLGAGATGSTGWADVATILPWNLYLVYGDKRILENQYVSMKRWVDFMESKSKNDLWNTGFHFGDWLFYRPFDDNDGRAAVTDKYLIAQCFWAHSTQLLINAAAVLGKGSDVNYYTARLQKIKEAFMREYVTPSGRLVSGTQTALVLVLNFDMLPEQLRSQAAERLAENIASYGNHLSTGFLGTPYLCEVLTRFGKTDVAYKLLLQETFPSWLYPVKMGATTIWERWSGIRPDSTFEPASMNSFNHYAYGAIGDWMYRRMVGIDNQGDAVGYKKIRIRPHLGEGFTEAKAKQDTYYGSISNGWKIEGNAFTMESIIPPNTTALLYVPVKGTVQINGTTAEASPGVKQLPDEAAYQIFQVGSGTYRITGTLH